MKQQTWMEISVALEILAKLLFSIVAEQQF